MTEHIRRIRKVVLEEVTQHLFEKIQAEKPKQIGDSDEILYRMILDYTEGGRPDKAFELAVAYVLTRYDMLQPSPKKQIGFLRDRYNEEL